MLELSLGNARMAFIVNLQLASSKAPPHHQKLNLSRFENFAVHRVTRKRKTLDGRNAQLHQGWTYRSLLLDALGRLRHLIAGAFGAEGRPAPLYKIPCVEHPLCGIHNGAACAHHAFC